MCQIVLMLCKEVRHRKGEWDLFPFPETMRKSGTRKGHLIRWRKMGVVEKQTNKQVKPGLNKEDQWKHRKNCAVFSSTHTTSLSLFELGTVRLECLLFLVE